jgi:hypothetical protein
MMPGRCAPLILVGLLAFVPGHAAESTWTLSASAYFYLVPEDVDYLQPTVMADRGKVHLEARYNYEDLETGSIWIGATLHVGDELSIRFTPILGGVFGATDGIAPGYKGTLDWRELEFYGEGEYVIDTAGKGDSFFYSWSELSVSPKDWFRAGLVAQRTRAYESHREFQRGILAGFSIDPSEITAYVFNPDDSRPLWVLSASVDF